ncbi:MerR family transcriptional regulator [Allokutzneria albata]|uniref:DNA-binding transcriptional regulator, MerR family n=1 Tax=Allokutzneria albata TaxID=211114 RepID=A0A1G9RY40_ALLAB|nr:MerR family transcriptional regulator [Allokutzneria albata]SDM27415.1 DNA-binding transcriptional regulator, MerR family [Allokutzneria albata]
MDETLTVSEAAAAAGVSTHTLRYYERAGLLDHIERGPSGRRRYSRQNLGAIEFILRLRSTGMSIGEIRKYTDLVRAGAGNERARLGLLEDHRDRIVASLAEQRAHLAAIEKKIGIYAELLGVQPARRDLPSIPASTTPPAASANLRSPR